MEPGDSQQKTVATWPVGQINNGMTELPRPVCFQISQMPAGYSVDEHQHPWGQLAYASEGIMKLSVPEANLIIPPQRAVWLPPNTPHSVSTRLGLSFRSLYINNELTRGLPKIATPINVDSLLKALIFKISMFKEDYQVTPKVKRLLKVLIDQIHDASQAPLFLYMPSDKRLLSITEKLLTDPSNNTTLDAFSEHIGATPRTINRLFIKQTKMGFVQWRQRLRILYSLDRIERGENISRIALDLGYESGSAFITMFKKHLGVSPKRFFKNDTTESEFSQHVTFVSPEMAV
jgi:AraC-like DNA-binding protein